MSEANTKVEEYDAQHGTYENKIHEMSEDEKLPSGALPKAPDPKPFNLGNQAPGGR